jgi:hypothetical protein
VGNDPASTSHTTPKVQFVCFSPSSILRIGCSLLISLYGPRKIERMSLPYVGDALGLIPKVGRGPHGGGHEDMSSAM